MNEHELLFYKPHLNGALDHLKAKALERIRKLDATKLAPANEAALFADLKQKFVVNPLKLLRDKMTRKGPRDIASNF